MTLSITLQRFSQQVTHNHLTATKIIQLLNVVVVGKVPGRKRATLPPVIALEKSVSVFKLSRLALKNVNALDEKTRMERGENK